jgi:hypothetical protein
MLVAVGGLLARLALPVEAQQQQPQLTVTWSGEYRLVGVASDNFTDYVDTNGKAESDQKGCAAPCKDSRAFMAQRWRLFTNVTSGDKKAGAVWAVEVGDITWGAGGGASGGEYGGSGSRTGNNTGGEMGADGVNLETKQMYGWAEIPGIPNSRISFGIQNVTFMATPTEFFSDDAPSVKVSLKFDPVDVELWWAKMQEGSTVNADDVDFYTARIGVNVTKELRFTVEGMVANPQCISRVAGTTNCAVSLDPGDIYWVGGTVTAKVGPATLDGAVVYGKRNLPCVGAGCSGGIAEESGFGVDVAARVPIGAVTVHAQAWYTTGDKTRGYGQAANATLTGDSDKLPVPNTQGSWYNRPLIAEAVLGNQTIGGPPGAGSPLYAQKDGTWAIGASAIYALTPAFSLGGGVAFVGASDTDSCKDPGSQCIFGDSLFEIDGGLFYTYNANLSFQGIASYAIPDKGDGAWAAIFRTRFAF